MNERFSRTQMLLGSGAMERLRACAVAVFGIGGVGSYALEALARSGVGRFGLFDNDKVCPSNINRQLHALGSTLGQYKADAARRRVLDINPECDVSAFRIFYLPETSGQVDLTQYSYIIDAIDTVSGKIELAVRAAQCGIPLISSMGAGNRLDPLLFEVADIYETSVCPLARVMRRELRRRGIEKLKVVYSKEPPVVPLEPAPSTDTAGGPPRKKQIPGSNAYTPACAGLIIASEVIKDLTAGLLPAVPPVQLPCGRFSANACT